MPFGQRRQRERYIVISTLIISEDLTIIKKIDLVLLLKACPFPLSLQQPADTVARKIFSSSRMDAV